MRIKALEIQPHGIFTDDAAIIAAQGEFVAKQSVLLSKFIEPVTLARLMKLLSGVTVGERLHVGQSDDEILARELCVESDPMILRALVFLFNRPELFRIIEQITNCPKIGKFDGRIYMMRPDSKHYQSWHDDLDGNNFNRFESELERRILLRRLVSNKRAKNRANSQRNLQYDCRRRAYFQHCARASAPRRARHRKNCQSRFCRLVSNRIRAGKI